MMQGKLLFASKTFLALGTAERFCLETGLWLGGLEITAASLASAGLLWSWSCLGCLWSESAGLTLAACFWLWDVENLFIRHVRLEVSGGGKGGLRGHLSQLLLLTFDHADVICWEQGRGTGNQD